MAVEKRLAGMGGLTEKKLRVVEVWDGDPEPQEGPDEELLVIEVVNTKDDEAEDGRVLRFDFGSGEGQTGPSVPKMSDATDSHRPPEGEKK